MNLDQNIAEKLARIRGRNATRDGMFVFAAKYLLIVQAGYAGYVWALPGADAFWGTATRSLAAAVIAWLATLFLQVTLHRLRPFDGRHEKPLMKPVVPTPSFPSAHATIAFSLAAAFALSGVGAGAAGLVFTVAALVAFSRMYVGVHYLSDVIAGAIVGVALTWAVLGAL